nr:uncharacterized protein LOC109163082 [Ipomoea batatas]
MLFVSCFGISGSASFIYVVDFGVGIVDKRSRIKQHEPGASQSCVSDDDFVLPPVAFLARLWENPMWDAPDYEFTDEEDATFPRVKTKSPTVAFVEVLLQTTQPSRGMPFVMLGLARCWSFE